jgi:hypothetical protein
MKASLCLILATALSSCSNWKVGSDPDAVNSARQKRNAPMQSDGSYGGQPDPGIRARERLREEYDKYGGPNDSLRGNSKPIPGCEGWGGMAGYRR